MAKFYREPWNKERSDLMLKWWSHFGTQGIETLFDGQISRKQIKSKATKLGLTLLSKSERLCIECREKFQFARYAGLRCRECHLARRKEVRKRPQTLEQWVGFATNTARYRAKGISDLTKQYMLNLWHKQKGRCFYSDIEMRFPKHGTGRHPFSPSIDRVNSKGDYVQGNVVWATWICNAGKNDLSVDDYIDLCQKVVETWNASSGCR